MTYQLCSSLKGNRRIVGVMGSHSDGWVEYSFPLGRAIAFAGFHLLTGGGEGVMTNVAEGFCAVSDRPGISIGICPSREEGGRYVTYEGYPNKWIELPIFTPLGKRSQQTHSLPSRNYINILSSHVVVVLPGSVGTLEETAIALTYDKPTIYFGPQSAFTKFPPGPPITQRLDHVMQFITHHGRGRERLHNG